MTENTSTTALDYLRTIAAIETTEELLARGGQDVDALEGLFDNLITGARQALAGQLQPPRPELANTKELDDIIVAALSLLGGPNHVDHDDDAECLWCGEFVGLDEESHEYNAHCSNPTCRAVLARAAIATAEKGPKPQPIVVTVHGGLVDEVRNIPPGLTVEVWDYDVKEELDRDEYPRDERGEPHSCGVYTSDGLTGAPEPEAAGGPVLRLHDDKVTCPACLATLSITPKNDGADFDVRCSSCRVPLHITAEWEPVLLATLAE